MVFVSKLAESVFDDTTTMKQTQQTEKMKRNTY
jgi:hypothetical protein